MTPQKLQELTQLNLPTVNLQRSDSLTHSTLNVQLEIVNLGASLPNYPSHQRLVQVQQVGDQIKVGLINDQNSIGKAAIRQIYEANFNWSIWLQKIQDKAKGCGYPLIGYHCIDYVIQRETYLGLSWEEAEQNLSKIALD